VIKKFETSVSMKQISILGCGWLGSSIARRLNRDYDVKGAVLSEASGECLRQFGLNVYVKPESASEFYQGDTLIIAIPPSDNYLYVLNHTAICSDFKQVILMSSTSVYSGLNGIVLEEDTDRVTAPNRMLEFEQVFQRLFPEGVIVRLGGLMGDDRIAGQQYRKQLSDGPVNYVHREDATNIVEKIIQTARLSDIFNAVAPEHPLRSELYAYNAKKYGFNKPAFRGFEQRIVSPQKLIDQFHYQFSRPDPMEFWN